MTMKLLNLRIIAQVSGGEDNRREGKKKRMEGGRRKGLSPL